MSRRFLARREKLRRTLALAGCLACASTPGLFAADRPGEDSAPEHGIPGRQEDLLEWAVRKVSPLQATLSTNFLAAVSRIDRMFGDDRLIEDAETSRLLLRTGIRGSRFNGLSFEQHARAGLSLPRTRDRLMVVWDQFAEGEGVRHREEWISAYEETEPDLELRLHLFRPEASLLSVGTGVRLGSPVQAYGRLRSSHCVVLSESTTLFVAQTLRYFSADRWVSVTEARLAWGNPEGWIYRIRPAVTWRERKPGCEPSLTVTAFPFSSARKTLRFDLGGSWPDFPHTREARYSLQATQRWRLGCSWLFGEVTLGVGFPQQEDYRPDPYVRVMMEMVLGNGER